MVIFLQVIKKNITRFLRLFLASFLFLFITIFQKPINAFGGAGPYNHIRITYEAIDRFSQETGWEVNTYCTEIIAQGSVVSDSTANMPNYTLHCDNNDLVGCSYRLDQFKQEANKAIILEDSLTRMGQSLHIVQDFYSHSNWVENFTNTRIQAPIEQFKIVAPPVHIQSGYFPDIFPDTEAQFNCLVAPIDRWKEFIYGATHACINKDSNQTARGITIVPDSLGVTYHELASQYAINHSVTLLKYYSVHNPSFMSCFHHLNFLKGCSQSLYRHVH